MITSIPSKNFTDTAALKKRFGEVAAKATQKQEVVDKLERMADGFLSLDGTDFDQDENPGSVAVGDDRGLIAFAQARPFGGVLSMEVLDERGPETKEYNIEPDLAGVSYSMNVGGVNHSVYQNGNGLLALMSQIQDLAPPKDKAPEA